MASSGFVLKICLSIVCVMNHYIQPDKIIILHPFAAAGGV